MLAFVKDDSPGAVPSAHPQRVECPAEGGVAIADQAPGADAGVVQIHQRVTGLLNNPVGPLFAPLAFVTWRYAGTRFAA